MAEGCLDDRTLERFAAGQCSPSEEAQIRTHLAGCARCTLKATQVTGQDQTLETVEETANQSHALNTASVVGAPRGALTDSVGNELLTPLGRGSTLGRYLILQRVGEGGMGVVYAAYDPELDRKVAIKLLRANKRGAAATNDDGQARLLREAQAMARVSHPNVVAVFDAGTFEDRVFLAMEFVDGQTVWHWLRKEPRSWREVVSTFVAAGRGLEAAHAAGLVHRDFKPENVLVDQAGRARVTDFGLARQVGTDASAPPSSQKALDGLDPRGGKLESSITREGTVVGTPQYMSPEQHLGRPPDARSDQFSFCAALYYALYRKHAFEPARLATAAREVIGDGVPGARPARTVPLSRSRPVRPIIQELPREPKVPGYVRRAIIRGLSLSPEDRFPSMGALLTELSRPPSKAWRTWAAAALGVTVLAVAAPGYSWLTRYRIQHAAEARVAAVWTPDVQRAIETSFTATGKPYASGTFASARAGLDAYAHSWVNASLDTGLATWRGEQTELVLSLRRACLDRSLKELKALTAVLSDADGKTVERAIDAVNALPDVKLCADVESLTTPVSAPTDAATRATLEKLSSTFAEVKALNNAGKFKRGLELAEQAAAEARKLSYRPAQAEALYWLGGLKAKTGDLPGGEQSLTDAVWAAEAGRQDDVKVLAATSLVYLLGYQQGRVDDAHTWERLGTAALERLGPGHESLEADLCSSLGAVYLLAGRLESAQSAYERALRLIEQGAGMGSPKRALVLSGLGVLYARKGDYPKARQALEESLALLEKVYGPDHPAAAYPHNLFSTVLSQLGDNNGALLHARRALAIWQAALGPDHPTVGDVEDRLGTILGDQGHYAESLEHYRRALEIKERSLGPEHPDLSYSLDGIGQAYLAMGRPQESVPYLERALALRKHDAEGVADTRFNLARALWEARQDRSRALSLASQAREAYLASGNKKEADKVESWLAASHP